MKTEENKDQHIFTKLFEHFYRELTKEVLNSNVQFIVLTHLVSDINEFIDAIKNIGKIAVIVAVPYSTDEDVLTKIEGSYKIVQPSLDELLNGEQLKNIVIPTIEKNKPTIIVEIGGYFSPVIDELNTYLEGNLIGIIEDTENGHRKYEEIVSVLPCPVLSVARSKLKDAENFLVGVSCVKATEQLLENIDNPIKNTFILGYGKIGQSVANAMQQKNRSVSVYDTDPIARVVALTKGFNIPDKSVALGKANLIFGTTGFQSIQKDDIKKINNGAVLVSCSSKCIEFDMLEINKQYKCTAIHSLLDRYDNKDQHFYVAGGGKPINFIGGRMLVGPIISIVHGEMLFATKKLLTKKHANTLQEISLEDKDFLAKKWIHTFCDPETGNYHND